MIIDRLDIISTWLLLKNISVWHILIIICSNPLVVLSLHLLSLSLFYTVVLYFDPVQRCCPQSSFFFFFFFFWSIVDQSVVTPSVHPRVCRVMERKKKFAFSLSLSNIKWLSLYSNRKNTEWLCFKIISFSPVGHYCIYFSLFYW